MFRRQNLQKRKRRAELVVDSLEERVVPSTASADGAHALAAEVAHVATRHPASTARFQAVVNRLNGQFQSKLSQIQSNIDATIESADAKYQATLSDTVARINTGAIVNVELDAVSLDNASNAVDQQFSGLLTNYDRQLNRFTRIFNDRLARQAHQTALAMPALRSAAVAVQGNFQAAESAFPGLMASELQAGDDNLQNAFNSVFNAIAAYQPPTSSTTGTAASAATTNQPFTLSIQGPTATNQAALNNFVGQLNFNFNTFQTTFATTPSGPFTPITPITIGSLTGIGPIGSGTTGVVTSGTGTSGVGTTTGIGTTTGAGTTNGLGTTTGTGTGTTMGTSTV